MKIATKLAALAAGVVFAVAACVAPAFATTLQPSTGYTIEASLDCHLTMPMVQMDKNFADGLLTGAEVNTDANANATLTLKFCKTPGTVSVLGTSNAYTAFVSAAGQGYEGLTYLADDGTWKDATYTVSAETGTDKDGTSYQVVDSMSFPIAADKEAVSLGVYINNDYRPTQFGGQTDAKYPATLTLDWSTVSPIASAVTSPAAPTKANPLSVKPGTKTFKAAKLKKKSASFKITVKNAKGAVTFKAYKKTIVKKNGKKVAKLAKASKLSVSKNGKVTLKKKLAKGTYVVKVTAAGNNAYKACTKTVTIKVK